MKSQNWENWKKKTKRWRKNEESRKLNTKFQLDTGGVTLENIESQAECERPIYDQEKLKKGEDEQKTFHPVKEPSDFWKLLWEQEGSGDPSAPWLGVVREAIKENVSKPREDGFTFEYMSARKVITTKNNWSAPWPEKIANFFTPAPPPKKMVPNPFSYIQVIRYRRSAIC